MDRLTLLKQMLPGLLPLFVFVIADEIWGTEIGLYVAVAFGAAELLFTYIRERRIDRFILGDTMLLVVLGLVSILLENDIFFKLKPALIQGILCMILAVSVYSPRNIVLDMSMRYMKHVPREVLEEQSERMKAPIKVMLYIFALHTILIVYSAYFMSKEAWVFISGGLFYIITGIILAGQLIYGKIKGKRD